MSDIVDTDDSQDRDFDYVRNYRTQIINSMMSKGVPSDLKEIDLIRSTLADMDRVTLGRKRIKTDEKLGNAHAQAAALIAELVMRPDIKKIGMGGPSRPSLPELPDQLTPYTVLPGELDVGVQIEDYESFQKRAGG
jgi:hypothetical protein